MKRSLTSAAFLLFYCMAALAHAESNASNKQLEDRMHLLMQKTKQLEAEIRSLERQMSIKKEKKAKAAGEQLEYDTYAVTVHTPHKEEVKPPIKGRNSVSDDVLMLHGIFDEEDLIERHYPSAFIAGGKVLTYIAGMPVVSSPYLGERPAFDGSDLITNISSINQDLRLLEQRGLLEKAFVTLGYPQPKIPIIALSGKLEPFAFIQKPYLGRTSGDMDVGSGELDIAAIINPWAEAFLAFSYDSLPPPVIGQRLANSNLFLHKGFVNIGNLNAVPFYATFGQLYVPFGRFSSNMISSPLPMILARTKARAALFGYKHLGGPGPYLSVYGFRSDTTLGKRGVGGVNLGTTFAFGGSRGDFGVSYISSVADSEGLQLAAIPGFPGFGASTASEFVQKTPAIDTHLNWSIGPVNLIAEYVIATRPFRFVDLNFNGKGAQPQSLNTELGYTFHFLRKPAALAVGYGWSDQALTLGLPRQRIAAVFNISIWRDTVESLEFRHDIDYAAGDFGGGITPTGGFTTASRVGTGKSANTVTAQIGVYF